MERSEQIENHKPITKRDPIIAFLLSFILPGLGQVYNGQLIKGIIIFILPIFDFKGL